MSNSSDRPQCVVAIDIGSDGCGYAFSADYTFHNDPCDISAPRWSAEVGKYSSPKTPSAILFDSKQEYVAFGYEAQDKYSDITSSNNQNNWYYVEGFKMALYSAVEAGEDIRNDFSIREMGGKTISAKIIFSSSIKFFYDHFMEKLDVSQLGIQTERIHWVISVPAIWTDSCKKFMRESALQAGIPDKRFSLVYEPEAASVYARLLKVNKVEAEQHKILLKTFKTGTKILVVDAGGGTVDISAQEVLDNDGLDIIHRVSGGDYGGKTVNMAFRDMLVRLFSGPSIISFKRNYPIDYIEMMRSFEEKKKTFKTGDKEITTRIAATLLEIGEENCRCAIEEIIKDSPYKGKLRIKRDKLFINAETVLDFFKYSLNKLLTDVADVLKHKRCVNVSVIMLVGGFAECEILRNAVKREFQKIDVFVPLEGGLSVLKGCVIYGHTPKIVSSRICNYTYGIRLSKPFRDNEMPTEKRYFYDGEYWCRDIFEISYKIDTVVNVGDKKKIELNDHFRDPENFERRKRPLSVEVFISDKENPEFVTDEGCRRHAVINVLPPGGEWPTEVHGYVEFEIGGTEMFGTYVNVDTGDKTSTTIEFLPKSNMLTDTERRRIFDPDRIDGTDEL